MYFNLEAPFITINQVDFKDLHYIVNEKRKTIKLSIGKLNHSSILPLSNITLSSILNNTQSGDYTFNFGFSNGNYADFSGGFQNNSNNVNLSKYQ